MKLFEKIIFALILLLVVANIFFQVVIYTREYTTRFDPAYWAMRYATSQWVVPNSKTPIGDDGLYAYAGWKYINGANPVFLNAEIPPLGKYLIGAGEVVFGNQNILILKVGLLCLIVFYLINLRLFKNRLLAFIPVSLFSFDPLFYSQLRAPYLDTMYLLFLLLTLYFAIRRKYFMTAFFLGCFASIKYPAGAVFLLFPLVIWVVWFDKKNLKKFLTSLIVCPIVFLLTYTAYFAYGGNPYSFLGVQKYIINFYATGARAVPGIVYPMILFAKWYTWFAGVQKVMEWNVFWAVSFIGSIFAGFPLIRSGFTVHRLQFQDKNMVLIFLWVASYLIFLTFTPAFPRYLLLLLPFMYNLTVWFLVKYVFRQF